MTAQYFYEVGPPPLPRGNRLYAAVLSVKQGFTPAPAGKSGHMAQWLGPGPVHPRSRGEIPVRGGNHRHRSGVHPRSRGEILRLSPPGGVNMGSPPLARGNRGVQQALWAGLGFTPARAGKS